jgi:hypothetical protein
MHDASNLFKHKSGGVRICSLLLAPTVLRTYYVRTPNYITVTCSITVLHCANYVRTSTKVLISSPWLPSGGTENKSYVQLPT